MNFLRPKSAVTIEMMRNRFRDNVRIVCNMNQTVGRPKKSVLGDVRKPIDREISAMIANALVDLMEASSEVFEPAAQFLYDKSRRAEWAAKQVGAMSKTNREAVDPDPFRQMEKMCGELITIERKKGGQALRILTDSATPLEIRIVADRHWKKGRRENDLSNRFAATLRGVSDLLAPNERFDEGKARHYDNIRRGVDDTGEVA